MEEPTNLPELVSEFAAITGASPLVADHYLSACNYDLNRAVEFYYEHPPAPGQTGARDGRGLADDDEAAAMAAYGNDDDAVGRVATSTGARAAMDDDEELQRALAESMADAGPGPRGGAGGGSGGGGGGSQRQPAGAGPGARVAGRQREVEVLDDDDEELPSADALLEAMARQREAALAAERETRAHMDDMMDRMLGALAGRPSGVVNPPASYPTAQAPFPGVPSLFPGMPAMMFPTGPPPLFGVDRPGRGREESGGGGGGRNASGGGGAGPGQAQRRRVEVRRVEEGGGTTGGTAGASGRADDAWEDELELPEGMSRRELEEARMMEAAMLGVPYEGRLADFSRSRGGSAGRLGGVGGEDREVAPEVREHRELRWDQDRAYEESLAADRAKEQAAARAKAEAEARERAQREAEEEAARAAAAEAARLAALVAAKASRLPPEPPTSAPDAINVMVRLPDGSRHSRRFARFDRLSSLFDFVDVELDTAAKASAASASASAGGDDGAAAASAGTGAAAGPVVKPGTYKLVTQFPRRVFSEADNGGKTFEEEGLAGGGGAAFFIEQTAG